jgi:hypothetical protein
MLLLLPSFRKDHGKRGRGLGGVEAFFADESK